MQYENIIIGDFLFSVGYLSCKEGIEDNQIDLYQQTPLDSKIGDVLAKIGGQNFIVEFKRNEKLISTELKKRHKDILLKTAFPETFVKFSKSCHFLSFPKEGSLTFIPDISINESYKQYRGERFHLLRLIEDLKKNTKGASAENIRKYINFLEKNSYTSSSGIVVNVLEGRIPLVLFYDKGFSMEKSLQEEMPLQPDLNLSIKKKKGIGR